MKISAKTLSTVVISLLFASTFFAQGSLTPFGNPAYHILDRLEVRTGINAPYHAAVKGWNRSDITRFSLQLDTANVDLSSLDKSDLQYIFLDNNEWLGIGQFSTTLTGRNEKSNQEALTQMEASVANKHFTLRKSILKYFYQTPANFFDINDKYFHIRVNPILNLNVSKSDDLVLFTNLRGLQVRGGVDDRIYFFMNILETQMGLPEYVNDRFVKHNYIPGQGFIKPYESNLFETKNAYDFLNGQAYVGYNITRHVGMQLGYGKHFIGNGYRSLILSDFSHNFFYLKMNWKIWKFHYQNIFAELAEGTQKSVPGGTLIRKKYMAAHYLSFKLLPNLELGFYETTVFSRENNFEFQYLNPVILYRLVEHSIGSPDNVLIGLNAKWNFLRHFQLYAQLMLDEFKFDELFLEGNGWWANKYGIQAGLKYYDVFGIDHFDIQMEYNRVRPYTYSFRDKSAPYSHFDQPLAHPLGANFKEAIVIARYQPTTKLSVEGRLIAASFGEDGSNENFGSNILLSYRDRPSDYGNVTGQGIAAKTLLASLEVTYMIRHNIFIDAQYFYRNKDSENDNLDQQLQYFGGGIRINIGKGRMDF